MKNILLKVLKKIDTNNKKDKQVVGSNKFSSWCKKNSIHTCFFEKN